MKTILLATAMFVCSSSAFAAGTKVVCKGESTTNNSVVLVIDSTVKSSPTGIGFQFSVDGGGFSYGNIDTQTFEGGNDTLLKGSFGAEIRLHSDDSADAELPNTSVNGPDRINVKLQCK
jgi:hypothetical protein